MILRSLMLAGVVTAAFAGTAGASEREILTFVQGAPNPKQLEGFLFPEAQCEDVKYQCLAVRPTTERAIGMDVRFPTGSADLTADARRQLEPWGKVLATRKGKLSPGEIVIEGHADARGSDEFNRVLSERRAQAVVQHLVSTYGVDEKALRPVGRGKERLRDATRPDSEVNRRVELVRKPK
jgi:outer membrane protein OmpA-like peptidoglycan-associated protein